MNLRRFFRTKKGEKGDCPEFPQFRRDQDFLRKLARETKPDRLHEWFNREIPRCLKKLKLFDPESLFIGDETYLFVPDNEAYEGSAVLLFDDLNHSVDPRKVDLTDKRYQWERCPRVVWIIHINRALDYFVMWP
jgi:hypothetical protein